MVLSIAAIMSPAGGNCSAAGDPIRRWSATPRPNVSRIYADSAQWSDLWPQQTQKVPSKCGLHGLTLGRRAVNIPSNAPHQEIPRLCILTRQEKQMPAKYNFPAANQDIVCLLKREPARSSEGPGAFACGRSAIIFQGSGMQSRQSSCSAGPQRTRLTAGAPDAGVEGGCGCQGPEAIARRRH